jgi:hypothetical protein
MAAAGVAPLGALTPVETRAAGVARRVPPRRPAWGAKRDLDQVLAKKEFLNA